MDRLPGPSVSWKGRKPVTGNGRTDASRKNFQKPLDLIGRFLVDFLLNPKLRQKMQHFKLQPPYRIFDSTLTRSLTKKPQKNY